MNMDKHTRVALGFAGVMRRPKAFLLYICVPYFWIKEVLLIIQIIIYISR